MTLLELILLAWGCKDAPTDALGRISVSDSGNPPGSLGDRKRNAGDGVAQIKSSEDKLRNAAREMFER